MQRLCSSSDRAGRGGTLWRRDPARRFRSSLLWFLLVVAVGCAGSNRTVFLDREANFDVVQRIAVLPLSNFTKDLYAPEKVEQILTIELLRARAFDVVDTTDTRQALATAGVEDLSKITKDQMRQVGESLEAQALLVGTVQEMAMDRTSGVSSPIISLHFELVDSVTGETLWSSVVSREGVGAAARLFGVGGTSTNEAIRQLVREALGTLIK